MKPLLAAQELSFGYREPVLHDVSFSIGPGECCALLGANGAGKSTLLRLLGGLQPPQRGRVTISGRRVRGLSPKERSRSFGYLAQAKPSAEGFAVHEVVLMGLYSLLPGRGWESSTEWDLVWQALSRVGISDLFHRPFAELSGGEQQRVLLARALVAEPSVLLLDEPLASLDPGFALELGDKLLEIKAERVGLVVATHQLDLVAELADQVLMLRDGYVMACGEPGALLDSGTLNELYRTKRFLGGRRLGQGYGTSHDSPQILGPSPSLRRLHDDNVDIGEVGAPRYLPHGRYLALIVSSGLLLTATILLSPLVGSTTLDLQRVWRAPLDWANNPEAAIFFVARLPRVLLAALVGAALALSGAVCQALLRNPLASPYTLGISAGATLGAFLAMRSNLAKVGTEFLVPGAALLGAVATTFAVLGLARGRQQAPPTILLLAGVTLNFTFAAVILLLQYFADFTETARMIRWMMGDLEGATYRMLGFLIVGMAPGWWVLARRGRTMNLLSLGSEDASAHGIDHEQVTLRSLLWSAWLTGLAVAVAGPVGFVGIIVPHIVRLLGGVDYRIVLPSSALGGAAFLVACDTLTRTILAPVELPIGVLTAILGGPFFLLLLLRRH